MALNFFNLFNRRSSPSVITSPANGVEPEDADAINLSVGAKKKSRPPFERYHSPEGELETRRFKISWWLAVHRLALYRLSVIILIALNAVFWLFALYRWADYLIFGLASDRQLSAELANFYDYTVLHPGYAPRPLSVVSVQILDSGTNKTDAVAELYNPNPQFLVEFDYYFKTGALQSEKRRAVMLPGENRPVAVLGWEGAGAAASADLVWENVRWQRIDPHAVFDPLAYQEQRWQFTASDVVFQSGGGPTGPGANVLTFKLTNASAFGYRQPEFYVGLFQGSNLVGLSPLRFESFQSLETKSVDLRNFALGLAVDSIQVYPLINVYDDEVYLKPPR